MEMTKPRLVSAVSAAQLILREKFDSSLLVDGRWGSYTDKVYNSADMNTKVLIDQILATFNTNHLAVKSLTTFYTAQDPSFKKEALSRREAQQIKPTRDPELSGSQSLLTKIGSMFSSDNDMKDIKPPTGIITDRSAFSAEQLDRAERGVSSPAGSVIFFEKMVPLIMRKGREAGMKHPEFMVAQCALESGWGKRIAVSYNYGGYTTTKDDPKSAVVPSKEGYGKTERVQDVIFKKFLSREDFVDYALSRLKRKWPDTFNANNAREYWLALRPGQKGAYFSGDPGNYLKHLEEQSQRFAA